MTSVRSRGVNNSSLCWSRTSDVTASTPSTRISTAETADDGDADDDGDDDADGNDGDDANDDDDAVGKTDRGTS